MCKLQLLHTVTKHLILPGRFVCLFTECSGIPLVQLSLMLPSYEAMVYLSKLRN